MEIGRRVFGDIAVGKPFEPDEYCPLPPIPDAVPATRPVDGLALYKMLPDGVLDTIPSAQGVVS